MKMKTIGNLFKDFFEPQLKINCPFCGKEIKVEYSLTVCKYCLSTIRLADNPTVKINKRDLINIKLP